MALALGSMYEFLFIISVVLVAVTFLLTLGHLKEKPIIRRIGKIANVIVTVVGFINIFAGDLHFK
jgi:hypothetical protein